MNVATHLVRSPESKRYVCKKLRRELVYLRGHLRHTQMKIGDIAPADDDWKIRKDHLQHNIAALWDYVERNIADLDRAIAKGWIDDEVPQEVTNEDII